MCRKTSRKNRPVQLADDVLGQSWQGQLGRIEAGQTARQEIRLFLVVALDATAVAWFEGKETLDSGWALGQQLLDGATAVVEAKSGEGKVFLMGPEVTFRGEPDGTFKLLFNALFYGAAKQ